MIDSTKFTKAALILTEAQTMITNLIGVNVKLKFEIESVTSITTENIIQIVAACSGVDAAQMMGLSRMSEVVYARFVCFFLMRKYMNMPLKAIGKEFNRDHSTVVSGLDVVENERSNHDLQSLLRRSENEFLKKLRHEDTI